DRKAGAQSHRSKGCKPYDGGITECANPLCLGPSLLPRPAFGTPDPQSEKFAPLIILSPQAAALARASLRVGSQPSRTEEYAPVCSPRAPSPSRARDAWMAQNLS